MLAWLAAIALMACAAIFLLPSGEADIQTSPVVINRVMTSNPSACLSVDGSYYDWIELKNTSYADVNLSGWKLSDSMDLREAFVFGEVTVAAQDTLIVYCDDVPAEYAGDEIFTGFRLSSDGEALMLADREEQRVDAVSVPAMGAADVYQRDENGNYSVISFFELSGDDAEYAAALSPRYADGTLALTELMAVNRSTLADEDGDYSDWIELYNGSATAIDLEGYALSDDDMDHRKWVFPQVTIQPGEYLVIFASGKDRTDPSGRLHTNFSLSAEGEPVRLYDPSGTVISYIEYDAVEADVSVSRLTGGALSTDMLASPGYENTVAGVRSALGDGYNLLSQNAYNLYINEVMCADSDTGDWVEIYNAGTAAADLSGMGLSDNAARPRKWQFPQGTSIPAGGYLVISLTGSGGQSGEVSGRLYADFALSDGERVTLSLEDGTAVDSVLLFDQYRGVSYGRAQNQARYRYFTTATPGAANAAQSYEKRAEQVTFSVPGGLKQSSSVTLTLSAESDARIYYTTDGSEPTSASPVYTGPITLSANTVVKAVAWRSDVIQSPTSAASYIFGASHSVRVVCVSGEASELTGANGTLNTGVKGDGYDVYVEVYEADGTQLVSQACRLKLSGHGSRTDFAQKAFTLKAQQEYGDNRFRASLFENRDYTEYKSVVMRASGQDNRQTHMRDSILTSLAEDTSVMYQETEVSVVYVNGEYWGLYNMREHISPQSIAQFEGWDNPDDITLIEGSLDRMFAEQGSKSSFQNLIDNVKELGLASDAYVEKLREYVDIENYLDYVAIQIYIANQDLNNVRGYRNAKADGKWRWILFDTDLSFQVDRNSINSWLTPGGVGTVTAQDNTLFIELMKNDKVRDYFLTRMGELLATTFSTENVLAKIQERYDILLPEMEMHCERWDWSLSSWRNYGNKMVSYARERPAKLIAYFQETLNLTDAQMQTYFGAAMAKIEGA